MAFEKILVLDDEPVIARSLRNLLQKKGYTVICAGSIAEAEEQLARESFDLLLLDVHLPDGDGTTLLQKLKGTPEAPMVIMITGQASLETALTCMRDGAYDYIIKPFNHAQIEITVGRAEHFQQTLRLARYYTISATGESELLGASAAMTKLRNQIRQVAPTEASVLIQGESGTGKELVAAALHAGSRRADKPLIKVNCAAIAPSLIESEFFGHEKGAFTGADKRRQGRFELAEKGTILLDEVGEIPLPLQAKLLRILQEREFQRVGGTAMLRADVRVIASTNRDLPSAVQRGEFREDLYYRLNVVLLQVPPLRERMEDVPILAEAFIRRFARQYGKTIPGLHPDALQALMAHRWPGNVRELQNAVERAIVFTESGQLLKLEALGFATPPQTVVPGTVHSSIAETVDGEEPFLTLEEVERRHILRILSRCQGNRTHAAQKLQISLRSLRDKIRAYRERGYFVMESE